MNMDFIIILDSDHTLFFGADPVTPHMMQEADGLPVHMENGTSQIELEST